MHQKNGEYKRRAPARLHRYGDIGALACASLVCRVDTHCKAIKAVPASGSLHRWEAAAAGLRALANVFAA